MIRELDTVALTRDIDEYGLVQGDMGAVVHCYEDGVTFEIEFVTVDGRTIALFTLTRADIRPIVGRKVLHVRELVPAAA